MARPQVMHAVVLTTYGDPDTLQFRSQPTPRPPEAGEVLVRLAGAGVHPIDATTRAGAQSTRSLLQPPMILGWGGSGTVLDVGPDVTTFRRGQTVVIMSNQLATGRGTYTEQGLFTLEQLTPAPQRISLVDAAAFALPALTAELALHTLDLPADSRLLVTGGTGAVGYLAVQLAAMKGYRVTALVRDRQSSDALSPFRVEVADQVPDRSVDAVLDTAGLPGAIDAVADGGAYLSVVPSTVPTSQRGIEPVTIRVQSDAPKLSELVALIDAGTLHVRPATTMPLAAAAEAHRKMQNSTPNRLVLIPTVETSLHTEGHR